MMVISPSCAYGYYGMDTYVCCRESAARTDIAITIKTPYKVIVQMASNNGYDEYQDTIFPGPIY